MSVITIKPKKKGITTDSNGKATEFSLCACTSEHILTFWVTTITFFVCFFVWFGNLNLIPWVIQDIQLTSTEVAITKSVLTFSTILSRVFIGDLCDKIGPRYCYIIILIMSFIPVCCLPLISSSVGYIFCNFFIGIIGSSFVITEYHTTKFFVDRLIGLANGTAAGWGNFGGGCAAAFMPFLASHGFNWRYLTLASGLLLLLPIVLYYPLNDTPRRRIDRAEITVAKLLDFTSLKAAASDYRTWVLFVVYAQCFGVELSIISFLSDYYQHQFNLSYLDAGIYVFAFSSLNLFARSVGGYGTDMLYRKFGIQSRVYTLCLVLMAESIFLFIFAFAWFNLNYSMLIMLLFSFYVQCAEGITYAIVPFVSPDKIGAIYGIVGAGGTVGSFLYSITVFWFAGQSLKYHFSFIILSICIFLTSFLTLNIKFTAEEVRCADELLRSFLKENNINTDIEYENQLEFDGEQERARGTSTSSNKHVFLQKSIPLSAIKMHMVLHQSYDDDNENKNENDSPIFPLPIHRKRVLKNSLSSPLVNSNYKNKKNLPKLIYKSKSTPSHTKYFD